MSPRLLFFSFFPMRSFLHLHVSTDCTSGVVVARCGSACDPSWEVARFESCNSGAMEAQAEEFTAATRLWRHLASRISVAASRPEVAFGSARATLPRTAAPSSRCVHACMLRRRAPHPPQSVPLNSQNVRLDSHPYARAGSLRGPANTATCDPDVRVHHHFPGI